MAPEARAYLWDARRAADAVARFIAGKDRDDYLGDDLLRSAVERQFEIVGEARSQLGKASPALLARLPDARNAIGFRNVLIHGYAQVDGAIVWRAATEDLPRLRSAVDALLSEFGDPP
jgi:uncharacterized protein with HEPN domain